jgi:hypothetical protein
VRPKIAEAAENYRPKYIGQKKAAGMCSEHASRRNQEDTWTVALLSCAVFWAESRRQELKARAPRMAAEERRRWVGDAEAWEGVCGNGNARFESAENRQSSRFISLDRFSELKDWTEPYAHLYVFVVRLDAEGN